jgi:hypothetical protein
MASDLADRAGGALSTRERGASDAGEVMGAPRTAFTVVRGERDPQSLKGMGYRKSTAANSSSTVIWKRPLVMKL